MRDFNRSRLQEELCDKAMENVHNNLRHSVQNKESRRGVQNLFATLMRIRRKMPKVKPCEMPKNAKRLEMPKPISQELCWHHQQCAIY